MTKENKWKIISIGGSIVIPKTGFDIEFLVKFKQFIEERIRLGERFILVVGGGATARSYQSAGKSVDETLTSDELDWIGIYATVFNAEFMRVLFGELVYDKIIINPEELIITDKPIIMAAGWKPGRSTDYTAVTMAKTFGAEEIFNLSNIEYVYDKDPNIYDDAMRLEKINWKNFRRDIVGYDWVAGQNAPFDPIASGLAEELDLQVSILRGSDIESVGNALSHLPFRGTVIGN